MSRFVNLPLSRGLVCLPLLLCALTGFAAAAIPFNLPTANRALFERGGEERFFVGTAGQPWNTGMFGCVRSEGWRFHEGLDIRCLQRDRSGEPTDPVMAAADGTVAYLNAKPGLSNYGNYIVLHHRIDGLEVYTLYAHLSAIQKGLRVGSNLKQGTIIATMGRTAATHEPITKDRAHVHFEMDLLLNPRFASWFKQKNPKVRNDHGNWNGQNLAGFDPRMALLAQNALGSNFNLVKLLQAQPEMCHVFVRVKSFPFLKTYEPLLLHNPRAVGEGTAGYEIVLSFNGLPLKIIPRAATEIKGNARIQLISVNEAEHKRNPGCRLITQRNGQWDLTETGRERMELLLY